MNEEIDYVAVAEALQHENERLRIALLTLRRNTPTINVATLWGYIEKNYLKIYLVMLAGWLAFNVLQSVARLFSTKE